MSKRVCSKCKKEAALFSGTTLCEPCNAQLILENNEIEERARLSAKPRRKFLLRDAIGLALLAVFVIATIIFALGSMSETFA
ncbi:MAG: hypothetical protein F2624_03695 [Actinobacteria bacterium]|jgi:hypothetical protein|uniref:Unannotated protein n=1 Tax=freshwater metagenome TaxID=449393 RepID=A0A6J6KF64_9ZZZZ|nr:hypothetical protein [Actinomycetota bacterium]